MKWDRRNTGQFELEDIRRMATARHRALWARMKREAARQGVSVRQAVLLRPRRP